MAEPNSCLYKGVVMHHRFRPSKNRFIYRVFCVCLDLDELARLDKQRFFSVNSFNLFSFHEKDHGSGKNDLPAHIRALLTERGFASATHNIRLLCYPRILGYTFNPLSTYFCYNSDAELEVILYEVSNTFGSRHTYLLEAKPNTDQVRQRCDKLMYVSPFMPMQTSYNFRIQPPNKRVAVCIRQTERTDSETETQPILHATFTGEYCALNDQSLLSVFFQYPLMTLKVMAGIHWEALKLWRKKLTLQPRDTGKSHSISWQDKSGVSHYESL
ncbi:DUF1365 domain-containing protein [Neptunomonas sp.]|uniref:DUF1365 domain-containing protein n=1 Tax=Neptunomonas sp. TaxID=1971898 RepID=UPI003569816C